MSPIPPFLSPIPPFLSPTPPFLSPIPPFLSPISPFLSPIPPFLSPISPFLSPIPPFLSPIQPFLSPIQPFSFFFLEKINYICLNIKLNTHKNILYFNIPKLFKLRNISKPRIFLSQNGFYIFTDKKSRHLPRCRSNISVNVVEKLCLALNCTPNDLLEWIPSKDSQVPENHPLHALKPSETLDLDELLKGHRTFPNPPK